MSALHPLRGRSHSLRQMNSAYASALEVIPRLIAENAGFDATDILNALRAAHTRGDGSCAGLLR